MTLFVPAIRRSSLYRRPDFNLFDKLFDDRVVPKLFSGDKGWRPTVDISERDTEFAVRAEVPGIDKNDIDITLTDGLLTITGEKRHRGEEKGVNYHRKESNHGTFCRTFKLPDNTDHERIDATYKDGVLRITIPKADLAETREVEISS